MDKKYIGYGAVIAFVLLVLIFRSCNKDMPKTDRPNPTIIGSDSVVATLVPPPDTVRLPAEIVYKTRYIYKNSTLTFDLPQDTSINDKSVIEAFDTLKTKHSTIRTKFAYPATMPFTHWVTYGPDSIMVIHDSLPVIRYAGQELAWYNEPYYTIPAGLIVGFIGGRYSARR